MKNNSYTEFQEAFLADRRALIEEVKEEGVLPRAVQLINSGTGSLSACLRALERHHSNLAGCAWFDDNNLKEFKQQCYIVAKLIYIRLFSEKEHGYKDVNEIYYSLFSDHEKSVEWIANSVPRTALALQLTENSSKPEYLIYQMSLAIRGDWDNLGRRAEMFLENIPVKQRKFSADMKFYLALARGDNQMMSEAIGEIVIPKVLKARKEDFWINFPAQFISPLATLYAKIAARHGYILELDTPFIPNEWLPRNPLPEYVDPYSFMHEYHVGEAIPIQPQ